MGRIKTQLVKRITEQLMRLHYERFKPDFNENKKIVSELLLVESNKLRNSIAGYVTRLVKKGKE